MLLAHNSSRHLWRRHQHGPRIVIMGAAGRDFHNFNVVYRDDPSVEVVAFTATQIPGIAGRALPGRARRRSRYPLGIPILPEDELDEIVRRYEVDEVVFAYSDVSHETVMHAASRVARRRCRLHACSARTARCFPARLPVIAVCAVRTGSGKSQTTRYVAGLLKDAGKRVAVIRHPMPYGDLAAQRAQRFETFDDLDTSTTHHRGARGVRAAHRGRASRLRGRRLRGDPGARPRPRPTSSSGTAATTTCPSTARTCSSSSPTRCAPATSCTTTPARRTCAWPMSSSSTRSTRHRARSSSGCDATSPRSTRMRRSSRRASELRVEGEIAGQAVVVVEDGPTLTHGGMAYGAGIVAARRSGASPVDPRPLRGGQYRRRPGEVPAPRAARACHGLRRRSRSPSCARRSTRSPRTSSWRPRPST